MKQNEASKNEATTKQELNKIETRMQKRTQQDANKNAKGNTNNRTEHEPERNYKEKKNKNWIG